MCVREILKISFNKYAKAMQINTKCFNKTNSFK